MKDIEVIGFCGNDKITYVLRQPFVLSDFWQISVNGESSGTISKYSAG